MTQLFQHTPVLLHEVLAILAIKPGDFVVDATAGGGGHLRQLAEQVGPHGHAIGLDRDRRALAQDAAGGVLSQWHDRIKLFHAPFSRISSILKNADAPLLNGLLADLGVSSYQLETKERGFSFQQDGPLDMRMDESQGISAYEWLEESSEQEIADALFLYGGERKSRAIARAIKQRWPIQNSTVELANLITAIVRHRGKWQKTHPATRSFQAIRMAVNREMEELEALLLAIPQLLAVGGRALLISFHSGEDRLIKHTFRKLVAQNDTKARFALVNKKPITASPEELAHNPRARSAKLRALVRME